MNQSRPSPALRIAFLAVLGINILIEAFISLGLLFDMPTTITTGFQVAYTPAMEILGLVVAFQVMVHIAVHVLAIVCTQRGRVEGLVCAYVVGVHMLAFGVVAYVRLHTVNALLLDGTRGVIVIALATLLMRESRRTA